MRNCELDNHAGPPAESYDTPLECRRCGAQIPVSSALNFEGEDYVRYFAGAGCLVEWCNKIAARRAPDSEPLPVLKCPQGLDVSR